jgi:hypothetical protein
VGSVTRRYKKRTAPPPARRPKSRQAPAVVAHPTKATFRRGDDYRDLIAQIDGRRVPLGELATQAPGLRYSIRHDIDVTLPHALAFARLEAELGIRASYFLLHTAPYFADGSLHRSVKELLSLGHEVGLHHHTAVSVTQRKSARGVLAAALERLRSVAPAVGTAAHGERACYRLGLRNYQVWEEFDPARYESGKRQWPAPRVALSDLGLEYEAYFLAHDHYLSDSGAARK